MAKFTDKEEEDLVRLYLTDIGQYPLLTKEDEVKLAQAIEEGAQAREALGESKRVDLTVEDDDNDGEEDTEAQIIAKAKAEKEKVELAKKLAKISPADKRKYRRVIRQADDAERKFVQCNLRLVVSIAKKYQASGLPLLDLIQEGNLGLMHAVEKFDWRKGFKFSTYATWWIRQAITRGIANTGRTIRLPVHAGDTLARLQKARSRLELKYGRPATIAELAIEVEMPELKHFVSLQNHSVFPNHFVKMATQNSVT